MRDLIPGLKTLFAIRERRGSCIELSTGSSPVSKSCRYEDEAVVPAAPWRRPTSAEMAILTAESVPQTYGSAISVISFPRSLLQPFEPLRATSTKQLTKDQISQMLAEHRFDEGTAAIIHYIDKHLRPNADTEPAEVVKGGIHVNDPAQCTTTQHPDTGKLVGLHVDNWSDYALERRARAPNRIAINLGCEDRFLLFVNLAIKAMYRYVQGLVRSTDHTTGIARVFMATFPSYPVVRLRIRPGEAYIAPTENLVHDGCTMGMTSLDITLSLRGRIALLPGN